PDLQLGQPAAEGIPRPGSQRHHRADDRAAYTQRSRGDHPSPCGKESQMVDNTARQEEVPAAPGTEAESSLSISTHFDKEGDTLNDMQDDRNKDILAGKTIAIEARNLWISYSGNPAVKNVTLRFPENQVTAII